MNINVSRRKAVLLTGLFATSLLATATAPARAQETTLAIKGYDTVAYFTDVSPSGARRSSNMPGMSTAGAFPAPSISRCSRRTPPTTCRSSETIARWLSP